MSQLSQVTLDDRWNQIQESARPSPVGAQFRLLISALDLGWRVEEPVYLRPRWAEDSSRVYHFILKRSPASPPKLVTVPEGPEVQRFVHDQGLRVLTER